MSKQSTHAEVAARWAQGLAGDWARLAELASPTMAVWHSSDDRWLDREESEHRMAEATPGAPPAFRDVRTLVTERGFVVQATLDGDDGPTHVVQILTVERGRIAACEEYLARPAPASP